MDEHRPPYRAAALAGIAVFALYAATLAPTTAFWDTSEYIATAHILGIPHPPGNPLFVALGRTWIVLLSFLPLSVAQRINLLAATTSAAAFGFFFLVAHRLLKPILASRVRSLVGAGVSVLVGATAYTVWHQSNVNEKVYTVSLLVIAATTWLTLRWLDRREEPGSLRYLLGAGYLMVLGSTNHLMSLLPFPALGAALLVASPRTLLRRDLWIRAVPLVVLGLSFNAFLPIRAARDPVINEGEPVCESAVGAGVAIYTMGRAGCPALAANLTREQYRKPPLTDRQAPFRHQLLNFVQYFDWQWARGAAQDPRPGTTRMPFTVLFGALGLLGLWAAWRTSRPASAYLAVLAVTLSLALVYYLNFEYGYSLAPEIQDPGRHEVRERDYFFIAGFALWGVLAGVGLSTLWGSLSDRLGTARAELATSPVLSVALIPLVFNFVWADRAGEYAARDWAYDLLQSVEPYGVLFTNGDNDTFPLWYLQEVEGVRRDVTVIVGQYLYTDWYPRQLREWTRPCEPGPGGLPEGGGTPVADPGRLIDDTGPGPCQRPFLAAGAPDFYRDPGPPPGPILDLEPARIDSIRGAYLSSDSTVGLGPVGVTYPEGTYLGRGDQVVLRIIRDVAGERPVYFSSAAGLMRSLGLDRWGVRHGLVSRLRLRPLEGEPPDGITKLSRQMGGDWFDVERSRALVDDVYRYRGLEDRYVWPDRSTLNIPWHYYALFLQLSSALPEEMEGREERVRRMRRRAAGFLVTAQGGRVAVPAGEQGR